MYLHSTGIFDEAENYKIHHTIADGQDINAKGSEIARNEVCQIILTSIKNHKEQGKQMRASKTHRKGQILLEETQGKREHYASKEKEVDENATQ